MTSHLDAPPVDRMAHAFTPPEHIREDEALNELYDEIVARMRREAEGIPMETNQLLLLAQIAADFVEMKYRDDTNSWPGTNSRKDAKAQWISLMAEWRQVLKDNKEKISEGIVNDFVKITVDAAEMIRNDDDRKAVLLFLKEQFSAKGY